MNSMTGFGRDAAQTDRYNILVEISGVNRKQTEIAVNVPRGYAEWDASVRSIVQGAVSRGRVGVSISVERLEEADGSLQLDEQKLASLAELLNRASDLTGQPLPLQASDLLRLDIVTSAAEASLSPEEAWPMVEKALKGESQLKACNYEFHLPKPSYTWHTLQALSKDYPDIDFTLLIGGDNWAAFDKWFHHDDILAHYPIVVYPRQGASIGAVPQGVTIVETPLLNISSTEIRQRIKEGKSIHGMVPDCIEPLVMQYYSNQHP